MAWEHWQKELEVKINKRIELAKEKITDLQDLIKELEDLKKSIQEPPFEDRSVDEQGYEEYCDELAREIDELFCRRYSPNDCFLCPLDYCSYISVVKKINECYNEKNDIDAECQRCELIRYCNHY